MVPHHGYLLLLLATVIVVIATAISLAESRQLSWQEAELRQKDERRATFSKKGNKKKSSKKPNIILILTDDQDVELGSLNYMPKTLGILRDGGAIFPNAFVTTPMCCPSRSSILTGMYVHNHNVYTNNDNCSSTQWRENYENRNFATYLTNAGYRTGYFGKYLNEYQGDYIPPGWTEWVGLIRNSRFYNYKLNFNGQKIAHYDNYYKDYLTDLVANDSVTFLKTSKQYYPNRPVAMVLSFPAPHGPEDSAPQHQHLFANVTTHRTPSWNFAPNPDKQWLLQYTGKMEPIHIKFTDILHRKRLQTLQSVDEAIEKLFLELKLLDELDNTYFLYTSDHGYHLGQYGMVKGKAMPYEFDVKVPFLMRGPSIPRGIRVPSIVINVDIAPTLLGMADVEAPEHMDGKSIMSLFEGSSKKGLMKTKKAWRDTFLIERGKITHKKIIKRERIEAEQNRERLVKTKEERVELACERPEYQPPCTGNQQWECRRDNQNVLRIFKCRRGQNDAAPPARCRCPSLQFDMDGISRQEMKLQKQFLKDHVNRPKLLKSQFLLKQSRLEVPDDLTDDGTANPSSSEVVDDDVVEAVGEGVYWEGVDGQMPWNTPKEALGHDPEVAESADQSDDVLEDQSKRRKRAAGNPASHEVHCRVLQNNTVVCEETVYENFDAWKTQKSQLDLKIQEYKERLEHLKEMRKHLKQQRPEDFYDTSTGNPPLNHTGVEDDRGFSVEEINEDEFFRTEFVEIGEEGEEGGEDQDLECDCDVVQDEEFNQSIKGKNKKAILNSKKQGRREEIRRRRQEERERKKQEREEKREEKKDDKKGTSSGEDQRGVKDVSKACNAPNMKCFEHDNMHWKTPPLWFDGPFCFCPNSNNNTYWCLRTINTTHNYLYCEFITGFISYYDMTRDPYQLRNAVHDLNYGLLSQLHNTLEKLKGCRGARECTLRTRPELEQRGVKNSPRGRRSGSTRSQSELRQSRLLPKWTYY